MPEHQITSDPGGRSVIAGTHVTVEAVLRELAVSDALDAILTTHPELDRDAVQAALEYAAAQLPVQEPVREHLPLAESEVFVPHTEFGKRMWALHQTAASQRAGSRHETCRRTAAGRGDFIERGHDTEGGIMIALHRSR